MTRIKVLSVECDQNSASLAIITESQRFIFQAGEGIQRLASEHKVKIGKICSVYTLSDDIASIGGLPGMLLTLDDAGVKQVKVYGPIGIWEFMKTTKIFMRQLGNFDSIEKSFDVVLHREKELTIHAIPLQNSSKPASRDICYVCETPTIVGKFDVDKAASLGIPKGPLFGKLKGGHAITLADGRVISPDQVLGDSIPSKYFALICNVSRQDDLLKSSLFNHNLWEQFRAVPAGLEATPSSSSSKEFLYMVHFSDAATVSSVAYVHWLQSFGPATKHIFLGKGCTPEHSSFISSMLFNQKLFHISPRLFPKLRDNSSLLNLATTTSSLVSQIPLFIPGRRLMQCHVLPHRKSGEIEYHASALPESVGQAPQVEEYGSEEVATFVQELKEKHSQPLASLVQLQTTHTQSLVSSAPPLSHEILFLGTGCAIPSKYRNVSSIAICVKQSSANPYVILLDAGEGTWYQLAHLTPPATVPSLANCAYLVQWAFLLRMIWISHPHADHHLGLIRLLVERKRRYEEYSESHPDFQDPFQPVILIAPMLIYHFLRDNEALYPELPSLYRFAPTNYFDPKELCKPCAPSFPSSFSSSPAPPVETTTAEVASSCSVPTAGQMNIDNLSLQPQSKRKKINPALEEIEETTIAAATLTGEQSAENVTHAVKSSSTKEIWKTHLTNVYLHPSWTATQAYVMDTLHTLGIRELVNIPVIHCPQSYGLILTIETDSSCRTPTVPQPFKFVYSGDTRPCDLLVEYGKDADVLIHEATFEDNKAIEAIQKRHSTISEAQGVAQAMHAKYLLLTHFSQRYHGIPMQFHPSYVPEDSVMTLTTPVSKQPLPPPIIAFDFMTIRCEDLPWLAQTTQLLAEIFPAETIVEESEES